MNERSKPVRLLDAADFAKWPVWEYDNSREEEEPYVQPVTAVPVKTLMGVIVGTQVRISNGDLIVATLEHIDAKSAFRNRHLLTLSVNRNGGWFTLSRYHDFDYAEHGPDALAKFLDLSVDQVFPITYDVRKYADGDPLVLTGDILKEPQERLSRTEIIRLAVP